MYFQEIVEVLEPAKVATENLSVCSLNLLQAEGVLKFLIDEVSMGTSDLATEFCEALIKRLTDRRHVSLMTLIQYLNNSAFFGSKNLHFKPSTKNVTQQLGINLMARFFGEEENEVVICRPDDFSASTQGLTLQQKLQKSIKETTASQSQSEKDENYKKEFQYYDRYQKRSPRLDQLFDGLCSVQPTSTQSERNFSLAGGFVSKLRTRLTDNHVDALCFLKSYFINQKNAS